MSITRLFILLALALLAGASPHSRALDADALGIHVHTWHADRLGCRVWDREYYTHGRWDWWAARCVDRTIGFYVRGDRWLGGLYANSVGRTSIYLGRWWRLGELGPVEFDASIFLVTGYGKTDFAVRPAAAIAIGVPITERVRLALVPIPPISGITSAALHVAIELAP